MLTVVLYGNSLALSGVGASLEAHPGLRIVKVAAAADSLSTIEPDVIVFDLAAARPDVLGLWRQHPHVLPIGVDMLEHRAVVFSEQSSRARTAEDLLRVIESGIGSKVKGERS